MRLLKKYRQLIIGLFIGSLIGSLIVFMSLIFWLWGTTSLNKHGDVNVTDFPKGIKKVTFDSDLVAITVVNAKKYPDYRFNPLLLARCKEKEYGEIIGMPYRDFYFFHYANFTTGPRGPAPLNDVHKIYPPTRWYKHAQQDSAGQPATRSESETEVGDKSQPEAEGRSR